MVSSHFLLRRQNAAGWRPRRDFPTLWLIFREADETLRHCGKDVSRGCGAARRHRPRMDRLRRAGPCQGGDGSRARRAAAGAGETLRVGEITEQGASSTTIFAARLSRSSSCGEHRWEVRRWSGLGCSPSALPGGGHLAHARMLTRIAAMGGPRQKQPAASLSQRCRGCRQVCDDRALRDQISRLRSGAWPPARGVVGSAKGARWPSRSGELPGDGKPGPGSAA